MMSELLALLRYFAFVLVDGDPANDWLTHLSPTIAGAAQTLGEWLAAGLGL